MVINPCKDCTERVVGCHSSCSKYIKWKEYHDTELKNAQKKKIYDQGYYCSWGKKGK